jgi:hypothetical protein
LLSAVATVAASQAPSQAGNSEVGRTAPVIRSPGGHPDLQGGWNFSSLTPLERPAEFAGKTVVTGAEAVALQKLVQKNADITTATDLGFKLGYDPDEFFEDAVHGEGRRQKVDRLPTSLIIDPPDGRLPPLTPLGRQRAAARAAAFAGPEADGPEARTLGERCLTAFNSGPPMLPGAYNNNMQIVQTRDYIVVLTEMIHTARIIPLDGRPHLPSSIHLWSGDSRGRWEGDTLIVETTNLNDQPPIGASSTSTSDERVIERLTLVDRNTLRYEFTLNDPATSTAPWTARIDMHRGPALYEYACHEANYALRNILSAARAKERPAAKPTITR